MGLGGKGRSQPFSLISRMKVASGPRLKLMRRISSSCSSSSSSSSLSSSTSGTDRIRLEARLLADLRMSFSSLSSSSPARRDLLFELRWVARGVDVEVEALVGVARAGERTLLRVREGEGETGSRGRLVRGLLDGPGVVVKNSDELGGVGSPPGASRFA